MHTFRLNRRGMTILFAVFTLLVMSVVAIAVFSLVSSDIEGAAGKIDSSRALGASEAGIQIGAQAIRNDVDSTDGTNTAVPSDDGYCGVAYLEGYGYAGSDLVNVTDPQNACLHGTDWKGATPSFCTLGPVVGASVTIWDFKQRRNLIGTRIQSVDLVMRARSVVDEGTGSPGDNPELQLEYTTDGGGTWSQLMLGLPITFSGWGPESYIPPISLGSSITWDMLMNPAGGFQIRAIRTNGGGRRVCQIDWFCLRVVFEVDALTEKWYTDWMNTDGTPKTVDKALGDSIINSISIVDESGKVHLNYATQVLLENIMIYNNVPKSVASNIVNYRDNIKLFDTVEELKQVTGVTDTYYDSINRDLTVYSWVNNDVTRSTDPRAPVNINTASENVLKAIFRCVMSDAPAIQSLTSDIITQRATQSFTHMYSSYAAQAPTRDLRSFAGFLASRGYLSEEDRLAILANADAALYNMGVDLYQDWTGGDQTATEFCYYSNSFLITAVGGGREISRSAVAAYGDSYDYDDYSLSESGTFRLPTDIEDDSPEAYWRELR